MIAAGIVKSKIDYIERASEVAQGKSTRTGAGLVVWKRPRGAHINHRTETAPGWFFNKAARNTEISGASCPICPNSQYMVGHIS